MIPLLAEICSFTAALIFFGFGIVYFYKSKSVKHHCSTIQDNLTSGSEESKVLIFALMRGAGGGAIAIALLTFWLQLQYSKHAASWIPLTVVIVDLLFYLPSLNAMLLIKKNTSVKPPVVLLSFAMLLVIAGYFLNISSAVKR